MGCSTGRTRGSTGPSRSTSASGSADTILDIGFGNGRLIRKLLREAPRKVCGIEISADMVGRVGRRLKRFAADGRLELRLGDVKKLPWADASFDKIYTVNTVYFWDDPDAAFAEIARTLKPGGRFLDVFYSEAWLDSRRRVTRHGFTPYSIPRLTEITERSGLRVVELVEVRPGASYCLIAEKI